MKTSKTKSKERLQPSEQYATFIVDKGLKKEFQEKCHTQERTMSGTLRFLMKAFIEDKVDQNVVTNS